MNKRIDAIDRKIRRLRMLERQMTDQQTLDGIEVQIADLEAEKAEIPPTRN